MRSAPGHLGRDGVRGVKGTGSKLGRAAHTCNPSTWDVEAGTSVQRHPWLHSEVGASLGHETPSPSRGFRITEAESTLVGADFGFGRWVMMMVMTIWTS